MTFRQARLSLQLLAEEEIGGPIRRSVKERRAAEDAAFAAAAQRSR